MSKNKFTGIDTSDAYEPLIEENEIKVEAGNETDVVGIDAKRAIKPKILKNKINLSNQQELILNQIEDFFNREDVIEKKELGMVKEDILNSIEEIKYSTSSTKEILISKVFQLMGLLNTVVDFDENIKVFISGLMKAFGG
ncbi:TPA: hypothetical protein MW161_002383 [Acinetobacter baumannii]|nr:hypothetical protein [Acinetobacter baumannii]